MTALPRNVRQHRLLRGRQCVVSVVLALSIALILNGPIRLRAFWRAAFFMPYVTAPVAIAIVWRNMLDSN